jgi:DNA-binding transcriptional regulator YiaG
VTPFQQSSLTMTRAMAKAKAGGMSYAVIARQFRISRQAVLQRLAVPDLPHKARNGNCESCGARSRHLHCHHLDYIKQTFELLCSSCHRKRHPQTPQRPLFIRLASGSSITQFQRLLLTWRQTRGLSQSEAAPLLGVPVRTLQSWEQGERAPRGLALGALLQLLKPSKRLDKP